MASNSNLIFPNYKSVKPIIPRPIWWLPRVLALGFTCYIVFLLVTEPEIGLILFWQILIPSLPAVFAFIPGLWRSLCPMAFLNQLPRTLGFTYEKTLSMKGRKFAFLISLAGFFLFISLRHPLFNHHGLAIATLAIMALLLALTGGIIFKGRSGWCGTFCPLAPIQKLYGYAPLININNSYCPTCLGCQNNCYDFNPNAAIFTDTYESDPWWADKRRFFAAALPGLIVAFFNASQPIEHGLISYYLSLILPIMISVGIFQTINIFTSTTVFRLVIIYSLISINLFYWFLLPIMASGLQELFGTSLHNSVIISLQVLIAALSFWELSKGLQHEQLYQQKENEKKQTTVGKGLANLQQAAKEVSPANNIRLIEASTGKHVDITSDQTLLDAIETAGLPIMPGCRMGSCGADPIVVVAGENNLIPASGDELETLKRLGLEGRARLACCCKTVGEVTIDLSKNPDDIALSIDTESTKDTETKDDRLKVVIIGNGIAGLSCAETLRDKDPECKIDLIGREVFYSYNRIALEKLIHGRTAMDGLFLFEDSWYKQKNLDVWLNTQVTEVNPDDKFLTLGTGETLPYDKLVLATGATAFTPPIPGSQLPGCFVLRTAKDALELRAWIQQHKCQRATVLGGGVLGVEAADALRVAGLRVSIIERGSHLMSALLDPKAGSLLMDYLQGLGIETITNSGIEEGIGDNHLSQIKLIDGSKLDTQLLVICAGIRANTELAEMLGLEIDRGIIVNSKMETSLKDIYAVGDAAEVPGALGGLWGVANEHGRVAAAAICGEDKQYQPDLPPPVLLKVPGINLCSFGRIQAKDDEEQLCFENARLHQWMNMVVKGNTIIGGVFVNLPTEANTAMISARTKQNAESFISEVKSRAHNV